MLRERREIVRWVADRLTVVSAAWLAAGLASSAFVIWAFTELVDVVVEGDSRAFDKAVLTTVLKGVFQRARPELFYSGYHASFYSFPSGHATVAFGLYGMLTLVLAYHLRGAARWAVVVSGILVVLLIGISRLYLGVHCPTDIVAGYLAALLWLVCVGAVYALWLSVRSLGAAESSRSDG